MFMFSGHIKLYLLSILTIYPSFFKLKLFRSYSFYSDGHLVFSPDCLFREVQWYFPYLATFIHV